MIPKPLADQVHSQLMRFKAAQDEFLQTYQHLCARHGGLERQPDNSDCETVFGRVRTEVIPIMEQVGLDKQAVQRLCAWAEGQLRKP